MDEARGQRHLWGKGGPELPPCLPQPGAPGASEQRPGRNNLSVPQAGAEATPHGPALRGGGLSAPPSPACSQNNPVGTAQQLSLKACKSKPRLGQRTGGEAAELPWGPGCPRRGNRPAPPGAGWSQEAHCTRGSSARLSMPLNLPGSRTGLLGFQKPADEHGLTSKCKRSDHGEPPGSPGKPLPPAAPYVLSAFLTRANIAATRTCRALG